MKTTQKNFDTETFSLRLSQLREAKNISARAMSHYLGHNRNYINQIETQKFLPSLAEFFEICNFLSVSPSEFFDMDIKNPNEISDIADLCKKLTPEQADGVYHMLKEFIR
ncbi:MAG: helix-turn-helix transcriptional regulator [Lachnospiraceae bacterium]|nr:helix-turn-helix transcriptional regulator [Lachnospiraceae bacterium]